MRKEYDLAVFGSSGGGRMVRGWLFLYELELVETDEGDVITGPDLRKTG